MLVVENLCKAYPGFMLKDITFTLPKGYIMGFIGRNGSGKSTTLKSILNMVRPDAGRVEILGKSMQAHEVELKKEIGFMMGPADYYLRSKVGKVADVYKRFFDEWDEEKYTGYLEKFNIDPNKRIAELSTGMQVKLGIAFALSHNAKLLIFDEPTSGLDPIARDELLELFREIMEDGERSILFSTHITSDLDKCADYIIFIRNGSLIANASKDELIDGHWEVAGKKSQLSEDLKKRLIAYKTNAFGFTGLIKRADLKESDKLEKSKPNLEQIMIYYDKGEQE